MPSISSRVPFRCSAMRFVVLKPIELTWLEFSRCGRRVDDDFDDGWRQPPHFRHTGDEFAVEEVRQLAPTGISFGLLCRIERREFFVEQRDDFRISVASGRHGLHDIARIERMVVSVVGDESSVLVIRREKSAAIWRGFQRERSIGLCARLDARRRTSSCCPSGTIPDVPSRR